jgi:hypothetical protein
MISNEIENSVICGVTIKVTPRLRLIMVQPKQSLWPVGPGFQARERVESPKK